MQILRGKKVKKEERIKQKPLGRVNAKRGGDAGNSIALLTDGEAVDKYAARGNQVGLTRQELLNETGGKCLPAKIISVKYLWFAIFFKRHTPTIAWL